MSLPWFAFDADAYTGDTPHLTCLEHGAYLLLMLAYYRSERPLPATDRALASICKLTEAQWIECKPALEGYFKQDGSTWVHERIEAEIAERNERHERWTNRAAAGGRAKAKKAAKPATTVLEADTKHAPEVLEPSLQPAQLQEQVHLHPKEEALSLADAQKAEEEGKAATEPVEIGKPIDPNFRPSQAILEHIGATATASTIELEIQKFVYHHRERGTFSHDWDGSFGKWWARYIEHSQKPEPKRKAPPRIEVNASPDQIDWDGALIRFKRNNSHWNTKVYGPAPDLIGCRVPREKLIEHGLVQPEETK